MQIDWLYSFFSTGLGRALMDFAPFQYLAELPAIVWPILFFVLLVAASLLGYLMVRFWTRNPSASASMASDQEEDAPEDGPAIIRPELRNLRQALDREELTLHYQPKVDLHTGDVLGAEALIRWNHPEKGLLTPIQFLPQDDRSSLSNEIGEWVIGTALRQVESWQGRALRMPVSVNVSGHHLHHPEFAKRLQGLLKRHASLPPGSLELEILESMALDDVDHVHRMMIECMAYGVYFALDDFGTGFSSIDYLKRLPFRTLKIDRSFVQNLHECPRDQGILKSIVSLSRTFSVDIVAEGLEIPEHRDLLTRSGCTKGQGYLIARPMPAEAMVPWLRDWRAKPSFSVLHPANRPLVPLSPPSLITDSGHA